jgi:phage replication initiation protein
VLELPVDIFTKYPAKVKHKSYQSVYQAGSIKVFGDSKQTEENPDSLGCYLVLSGRGCDEIFHILNKQGYSFGDLFCRCEWLYGSGFHFTRLDVAIDDRSETPYFTPEQIQRKCEREEFIGNSNSYRFVESSYTEYCDTAKTVYIGTGKSNLSYRFYDKDKEVSMKYQKPYEEIGSWKRTEIQLRENKAHTFAMFFKDNPLDLGKLAFDLLAGNLRFIIPDEKQSNRSRWKTCQFWKRFLGAVEPLQLHIETPQSTLLETQRWLKEGGVLSAVKGFCFLEEHEALGGLERIEDMLNRIRYSPSFGNKMIGHLTRINREDLIPYVQGDMKKGGVS